MKHSQEEFLKLVNEAYNGELQLPAFQRDFKWEPKKVISLFDSLRKGFPIGNFLFLEKSAYYNLAPKLFEKVSSTAKKDNIKRLVLDGQQRITAGISLLYAKTDDNLRYFLDLQKLIQLAEENHVDYENDTIIKSFLQEIDDDDNYIIRIRKKGDIKTLLLKDHLLSTTYLISKNNTQRTLYEYEEKHSKYRNFLRYLIIPNFHLENKLICPVTTLDDNESLAAVTKIFATINTTGKRLTPIEIVTATLFAADLYLKKDVEDFKIKSEYFKNIDPDGEVHLQTIAMLADKPSKKSLLPKTITKDVYKAYYEDSLLNLDEVGKFLTKDFGVGLNQTNKLVPYDSILAPMAYVYNYILSGKLKPSLKRSAEKKLIKWLIGAALSQRYVEGVNNKQQNDAKDFKKWIETDDNNEMPSWLRDVTISSNINKHSPNGAIGRLIKCIFNNEQPRDPIEDIKIGYYDGSDDNPEEHHIWSIKYCSKHLDGWNIDQDNADVILNIMLLGSKTNKRWDKMNPADQISDIKKIHRSVARQKEIFKSLFLSEKCVEIMSKSEKTKSDFYEFIQERYKLIVEKLESWGFTIGKDTIEEEKRDE